MACLFCSVLCLSVVRVFNLFSSPPPPLFFVFPITELLDRDSADGDVIIQGSMITPFPPAATGAANEPNFFWSGSGDDPDAGMTYWITTTVVKTTLVTLSPPPTPSPSSPTTTTTTERVEPTPVLRVIPDESAVDWPREASLPEYWLRTVFRTDRDDEQSPNFRHLLQSGLKRLYANSDVRLVNITRDRSSNDGQTVQVVYALLSLESRQIVEPHEAVSSLRAMTNVNVTRQLCHGTGDTQKQDVLCQSIVTRAERNHLSLSYPYTHTTYAQCCHLINGWWEFVVVFGL